MKRHGVIASICLVVVLSCAALLCACSSGSSGSSSSSASSSNAGDSSAAGSSTVAASDETFDTITVGTLATEDILPYWVAEDEGLFAEAGLDVQIQTFQSATELIAGITSGEVDLAMTDPMVTASIHASGTPVRITWVTLGADASQGRFGIMTADSSITSLADLAGVEIGVGSNTILEYVMDRLMADAGIAEDQVVKSELQKLPVRYEAMASGQVKAAALPASLLALGEADGYTVIADDTQGENISQSVMIVRESFLGGSGTATDATTLTGEEAVERLAQVWDQAVERINAAPENYRELLVSKANLSDKVAQTYAISTYPTCALPTADMIDPVLEWMSDKGYLTTTLSYNAADGSFTS